MLVSDLMNDKPLTLGRGASLAEALDLMAREKNRHVVVVEEGAVVGILSDRDLALFYDPVQMTQERWRQASVGQLMTPDPITVGSGTDIASAAKLLLSTAVSALPIVDNGALVGILSEKDFVRHFARGTSAKR